ncbi:hypothetical protein [Paraburkholderia sp. J10-1]|uniref:hypothetical protein n=1 Tax=Paraburkholderia sp. J10-1 TaxID=2805430 RepID=UPI002AB74B3F|nr:hypothetical protein [Paraburkholderia sp. J10-1]
MEKARYHNERKASDEWKAKRVDYLQRLKARLAEDPEFAAIFRAYARERCRQWRIRVMQDHPARREELLVAARAERASWRARMLAEPGAWEAHKFKARAWYHSLSAEDRERIFYAPRKKRAQEKQT